jgi:hypothetical protein
VKRLHFLQPAQRERRGKEERGEERERERERERGGGGRERRHGLQVQELPEELTVGSDDAVSFGRALAVMSTGLERLTHAR